MQAIFGGGDPRDRKQRMMLIEQRRTRRPAGNRWRRRSPRGGAVAVEAALLAPLLVIVVLGVIDLGQFINVTQMTSNASRIGAREAAQIATTTTGEVHRAVYDYMSRSYPNMTSAELDAALDVTVKMADGSDVLNADLSQISSGEKLYVRVAFDYSAVRWMGPMDEFWVLDLQPIKCYCRRE